MKKFDVEKFKDYVVSHGYGEPTVEGIKLASEMFNGDYAECAAEIVTLGMTRECE